LTLKELKERINLFTLVHQKQTGLKPASHQPAAIFKALGDELRLALMLLIRDRDQLCVCELTEAFDVSQPKISRHLASLRDVGLLDAERRGQWVYYSLDPQLPDWVMRVLEQTADSNTALIRAPLERLLAMTDRPGMSCL
jgi:ArsR family transcriptional regulator